MATHPLDVISMFPEFQHALSALLEFLVDEGLEVYPRAEAGATRWYWRWRPQRLAAHAGAASMGDALLEALRVRLAFQSPEGPARSN